MLKSYDAIYEHGRVEWIGDAPRCGRARILVVVDETPIAPDSSAGVNGDRLADLVESLAHAPRKALSEKFGDPVAWQRLERQERPHPERDGT